MAHEKFEFFPHLIWNFLHTALKKEEGSIISAEQAMIFATSFYGNPFSSLSPIKQIEHWYLNTDIWILILEHRYLNIDIWTTNKLIIEIFNLLLWKPIFIPDSNHTNWTWSWRQPSVRKNKKISLSLKVILQASSWCSSWACCLQELQSKTETWP